MEDKFCFLFATEKNALRKRFFRRVFVNYICDYKTAFCTEEGATAAEFSAPMFSPTSATRTGDAADRAGDLKKKIREIEERITAAREIESKLHVFDIKFKKFLQRLKNAPKDKISLIKSVVSKVYINTISENHEYDISVVYKIEEI